MTTATVGDHKLKISEKLGYAMGDGAANLVWRGALGYLAVFYTDVLGITAKQALLLLLVVRLLDGILDIVMGMLADRTMTKWGKFRPYVLWSAPILGMSMVLSFTTPDLGPTGKLIWAYCTYIGLNVAYTVNNVPYSAMMGVMTSSHSERNILSSWRFFGAFAGGVLVQGFSPDLVAYFGGGNQQQGYQYTMFMFSVLLVILLMVTFFTTKERVIPPHDSSESLGKQLSDLSLNLLFVLIPLSAITLFFYFRELYSAIYFVVAMAVTVFAARRLVSKPRESLSKTQNDFVNLITNVPWWILLAIGFLFMMFNGIKQGTVAYYFKYYVHDELLVGKYFIALLIVSMIAALCTGYLSKFFGKKNLFIASLALGGITTGLISLVGRDQVGMLFTLGCVSEIFAAIMPVLFFSMLGDAADFSEWKTRRRATGLFFSAGTFINKTGGGFSGALILLVLSSYGYVGTDPSTVENALDGMKWLMSWIPAGFAFAGAIAMMFYPLSEARMNEIEKDLQARRAG